MSQFSTKISPPKTNDELSRRAERMAGKTIGQVAEELAIEVPENLRRKKGWQGQFIELALGANAGNLSQPDFIDLNIELKTLPIDYAGKVLESTYVCVLNLADTTIQTWPDSPVFRKLQHVLWVPIARDKNQSVVESKIATPFLWRPSRTDFDIIRQDWENAMEMVSLGRVDQLNARQGEYLQVRPKAANSRALTRTYNSEGKQIETLPRGFYLRPSFTQKVLLENLQV
ncbi:DNA mismatch repair endonuclease MutH [Aliikangiella marina]|uniref:DNA mismatch repair protein MutH n=1 Tax=Aliikangiella marina TaxID=1712262 RepID=A0A545T8Q4_9GAMM|nr:DNA mismatch repair endonuclease MutH [Aliikangiella marina]TQV73603.1 DNA mismatch repair endonuclease MutH [Aliikangiella marina]